MKKIFKRLSIAFAALLSLSVSANNTVNEVNAATTVATMNSDTIVNNSGYQSYSTSDWIITCGGNNKSIGSNDKNKAKCVLGTTYESVGAPLGYTATTTYVSAAISKIAIDGVTSVEYSYSGAGGSGTSTTVSLVSSDTYLGTYVEIATKANATSLTFEVNSTESRYYALVFKNTSWFRIDSIVANFNHTESTFVGLDTPENLEYNDKLLTWDTVDNADYYEVDILNSKGVKVKSYTVEDTSLTLDYNYFNNNTSYSASVIACSNDTVNFGNSSAASTEFEYVYTTNEEVSSLDTTASLSFGYSIETGIEEVNGAKNVEFTFTVPAKDSSSKKYEAEEISMEWLQGGSSTKITDYVNPIRVYKYHTFEFTASEDVVKFNTITIVADSAAYATAAVNSTWEGATASADGANIIVTLNEGSKSAKVELGAQSRWHSVSFNYEMAGGLQEVVKNQSYSNVKMKFGAEISTDSFASTPTAAGVILTNETLNDDETIKGLVGSTSFASGKFVASGKNFVNVPVQCTPAEGSDLYSLAAAIVVDDESFFKTEVSAAVYFVVDGQTIILNHKTHSVETMVNEYIERADELEITDENTLKALRAFRDYIAG